MAYGGKWDGRDDIKPRGLLKSHAPFFFYLCFVNFAFLKLLKTLSGFYLSSSVCVWHIISCVVALYFLCQVGPQLVRSGRPTDTDVNTLLSPLCAEPGPGGKCAHSRGRVDEALRARGCTERRGGGGKWSHYIYVGCFLAGSCWGCLHQQVLLRFSECFPSLFPRNSCAKTG